MTPDGDSFRQQPGAYPTAQPGMYQPSGYTATPAYPVPPPPPPYGYPPPPAPPRKGLPQWVLTLGIVLPLVLPVVFVVGMSALDSNRAPAEVDMTSCTFEGGDTLPTGKLGYTLKNTSSSTRSYTLKIEYRDGSGNRVDTDTAFVRNVAAGDTVRAEEITLLDAPIRAGQCRIVSVS